MKKNDQMQTCVTFLTREQVDYLDKIGKDCLFKYNHKLPRTRVLFELVELLKKLNINVNDIDLNKESLSDGILRIINNGRKTDV